jgi:transcriptional regulator with XRE-family HTH domain
MCAKLKTKYPGFASFLRTHREINYRSARDFCSRVNTGISYPQYSRYEAGDQLPSLPQALSICGFLEIPPLETLLEWNRAQLVEASDQPGVRKTLSEIDALISRIRSGKALTMAEPEPEIAPKMAVSAFKVPLDKVVVFNRSHRDVFLKHPAYRDIFTYINAFHPERISGGELARALKLSPGEVEAMLDDLEKLGVVLKKDGMYSAAKRNFYFPDDLDFFELRNENLRHNFDQLMGRLTFDELSEKKAFRGVITREFTREQYLWVIDQAEKLLAQSVGLPEDTGGNAIYSVLTVVGERFRRSE